MRCRQMSVLCFFAQTTGDGTEVEARRAAQTSLGNLEKGAPAMRFGCDTACYGRSETKARKLADCLMDEP